MNTGSFAVVAICVLLVAGCDVAEVAQNMVPQPEAEFAKQHLALYQAQRFDEIIRQLNPEIVDDNTRTKIEEMASYFPREDPSEILTVGSHTSVSGDIRSANLTFQYQFSETYLLASVGLLKRDGQLVVNGINLQVLESSLQEMNEFNINGRGAAGYVFLVLAVSIPVFIVGSFASFLRTPIPRRKWLWGIFILMGVGVMRLNWSTGEFGYSMLSWQLLGVGFVKTMYGPLVLSIAAPLGAIVFWTRREQWLRRPEQNET